MKKQRIDIQVTDDGIINSLQNKTSGKKFSEEKTTIGDPRKGGGQEVRIPLTRKEEKPPVVKSKVSSDKILSKTSFMQSSEGGVVRAAKLLLALGPDQAGLVLKELADREVEMIVREMLSIQQMSSEERKQILHEFQTNFDTFELPVEGGLERTQEILLAGIGEARTKEIISRLNRRDIKNDFEFLEKIDAPILASSLTQEHPQVAAVALSFISPRSAASVMKHFPEPFRAEVALRIARTSKTHPDALERVAKTLREKFEKRTDEIYSETGGASALASILNHMDRGSEDQILNLLGDHAPDILDDVKDLLYTFEELTQLTPREMRLLLSRVDDDEVVATALRGAPENIKRHFFNSLSQNRAADIADNMQRRGPLSVREINEARTYILNVGRKLDDDGTIIIKKQKEEYI